MLCECRSKAEHPLVLQRSHLGFLYRRAQTVQCTSKTEEECVPSKKALTYACAAQVHLVPRLSEEPFKNVCNAQNEPH